MKKILFASCGFVIVILFSLFLSGCNGFTLAEATPTCALGEATPNAYQIVPMGVANIIFEYAHPPVPTSTPTGTPDPALLATPVIPPTLASTSIPPQQIQNASYEAFQHLIKETQRWSDIEKVRFNDGTEAEIVVTFISPELLQAVLLNNILKDGIITSDFQAEVKKILDSVAERGELLFMFTVTLPANHVNNHTMEIPVGSLTLNNTENAQLTPSHHDPNLGQPINVSPAFGYVAYPQVEVLNGECKRALDPKYNANIVLALKNIQVDGAGSGPYSWTIPYAPLINSDKPPEFPLFVVPPNYDQTKNSPHGVPPVASQPADYWRDFARFVWFKTTLRY